MKNTAAIVLAAGQGKRMHTAVAKQFLLLKGEPILSHTLRAFEKSRVETVILVTGEQDLDFCRKEIVEAGGFNKVEAVVAGGKERYHSVYAGLLALKEILGRDGMVLIHDGARPLVDNGVIERTMEAAAVWGASAAAVPVKDTIKRADSEMFAAETLDRSVLWQMQTPQTFSYGLVLDAYERLLADVGSQQGVTDDAMVVERMTHTKVRLAEGSYRNLKITTPEDLAIAECLLDWQTAPEKQSVSPKKS